MRRRSPSRWLAPLALVTCAVAAYTVVNNELLSNKDSGAKTTSSTKTSGRSATGTTATTKRKTLRKAKSYTVQAGDSFSVIAAKEGIDPAALQAANPNVDPSTLHPGQKLKLPR